MIRNAFVLVLDEATASCEIDADKVTQEAVASLTETTVITIAHRLDAVLSYDKIAVMDKGKVIEYGTPSELREQPGSRFAALLRAS